MAPPDHEVVPVRVGRSIVRVLPADGSRPVGLAFALDRRHLVTCAHVVNVALQRATDDLSPPDDDHVLRIELRVSSDGPRWQRVRSAGVVTWLPGRGRWSARRDVAVLEVAPDLPETVVCPPLLPGQSDGIVRMIGPDSTRAHEVHVDGSLKGEVDDDLLQVDENLSNVFRVAPGFSGGPVWRPGTGQVVGMLVAGGRGQGPRDVYAIDAEVLVRARSAPGLPHHPVEPAIEAPESHPGHRAPRPGSTRPVATPRRRLPPAVAAWWRGSGVGLRTRAAEWVRHPLLATVSVLCGLVALAISLTRTGLGWSLLYGVRAGLVVHLAGVAAGTVAGPVAAAVAVGRRRRAASAATAPEGNGRQATTTETTEPAGVRRGAAT